MPEPASPRGLKSSASCPFCMAAYSSATITLQMIKAMIFLNRGLSPPEHRPYVQEFKMLLKWYLECRIEHLME